MIVEGNQWNVLHIDDTFTPEHPKKTWKTAKLNVDDEVVLDGVTYCKIKSYWGNNSYFLIMREDTLNKKIYRRHSVEGEVWEELLYDFSMKANDTMVYYKNYKGGDISYVIRVDSIREVKIGDNFETREFFNSCRAGWESEFTPCGNWIEGMGTYYGLNPRQSIGIVGDSKSRELLCFKKDGELVYMNSNYETCNENSNAVFESEFDKFKIYQNPVSDYLSIDLPAGYCTSSYLITDVSGRLVLSDKIISQNNITIDVSQLQPGLYLIKFCNGRGKNATGKFVVN